MVALVDSRLRGNDEQIKIYAAQFVGAGYAYTFRL